MVEARTEQRGRRDIDAENSIEPREADRREKQRANPRTRTRDSEKSKHRGR